MIAWAAEAIAASALLMVLVLLARAPVRHAFGAEAAYGMWALPALRLLLPPLPAWHRAAAPLAAAGEPATVLVLPAAPAPDGSPLALLIAAWLIGAALLFAWQAVAYARFRRRVLTDAVPLTRVGRVRIVASAAAPGPVAFGVLRPAVAVPLSWEARFDAETRELAIAHELAHHARGDLLANWAALAVLALHWFNPVAWCAYRAFRSDQEQTTDARVLAATAASPRTYARCIVTAASGRTLSPACHLTTLADLKRRLTMLTRPLPTRRRVHAGIVGTAALAAAGLGLTASSNATEPAIPAAHRLRAHLARAEQPARMAAMASMPEVPTPPNPAAPAAGVDRSVTVTRDSDASPAHYRIMQRDRNGRVTVSEGEGTPPGIAIPEVRNVGCEDGDPHQLVSDSIRQGRRVIAVCTNRVQALSRSAETDARGARAAAQDGNARALEGLTGARRDLLANTGMSGEDRQRALAAIDGAIASLRPEAPGH